MVSILDSQSSYLVSADIGILQVQLQTVSGYDIEDIVHDRAISQARLVQLANLGKSIDPTKPVGARTISSVWLNNEVLIG